MPKFVQRCLSSLFLSWEPYETELNIDNICLKERTVSNSEYTKWITKIQTDRKQQQLKTEQLKYMEQAVADRKETPIWFLHGVERNGICTQFIHIKNVQIASDLCSIYS